MTSDAPFFPSLSFFVGSKGAKHTWDQTCSGLSRLTNLARINRNFENEFHTPEAARRALGYIGQLNFLLARAIVLSRQKGLPFYSRLSRSLSTAQTTIETSLARMGVPPAFIVAVQNELLRESLSINALLNDPPGSRDFLTGKRKRTSGQPSAADGPSREEAPPRDSLGLMVPPDNTTEGIDSFLFCVLCPSEELWPLSSTEEDILLIASISKVSLFSSSPP